MRLIIFYDTTYNTNFKVVFCYMFFTSNGFLVIFLFLVISINSSLLKPLIYLYLFYGY